MKIIPIIHQQFVQLRWHILACLGLMMALPIEEAIINMKDGDGFYASHLSLMIPMMASPLLAGLIACANVQADLNEKRHHFWRSKPVSVTGFMIVKYIVGLIVALLVIAAPVMFALITTEVADIRVRRMEPGYIAVIVNAFLILIMTYSLCFVCNVLIRKTARAWLVGMALVCLMMLIPFILPLQIKDVQSDFLAVVTTLFVSIYLGSALIGTVLSFIATVRNWHLQANLKGLLWIAASVVFLLMLLFSRQVANIKVVDEVRLNAEYGHGGLWYRQNSFYWRDQIVNVENDRIILTKMHQPSQEAIQKIREQAPLYNVDEGLKHFGYPRLSEITIGDNTFSYKLTAYYSEKSEISGRGKEYKLKDFKKIYLIAYQYVDGVMMPLSAIDLSDCCDKHDSSQLFMDLLTVKDYLCVYVNRNFLVYRINEKGQLHELERDVTKKYSYRFTHKEQEFKVPLLPSEKLELIDRIKLSIDFNRSIFYRHYSNRSALKSSVDIQDGAVTICCIEDDAVVRYDVIKWDEEYVYCKYRDSRSFTLLEQILGPIRYYDYYFVQDGKLYAYERRKLMVFDVRSERIRKLGHFERVNDDFDIVGIEVLENSDILLCSRTEKRILTKSTDPNRKYDDQYIRKNHISLLKNPQ